MSKELGIIKGLKEIPSSISLKSDYMPSEMYISAFYGGVKRGRCIQISLQADKDNVYSHIQLTAEGVEELRKVLNDWDDEYTT